MEKAQIKIEAGNSSDPSNLGHWTVQENLKYIIFLNHFKSRFLCRLRKKKVRLFQEMSEFIGSRSSIQCRTHHQKYENKLGEPKKIVRVFKAQMAIASLRKIEKSFSIVKSAHRLYLQDPKLTKNAKDFVTKQRAIETKEISVQTDPVFIFPQVFQIDPQQAVFYLPFIQPQDFCFYQ